MSTLSSGDFAALTQDLTAHYTLGPLLGRGAFGVVHRARDLAADRDVAIKLLNLERTEVAITRFVREANVVAALEHPGVIRVHAAGRHGGRPAIVYELVEGSTFSAAVRTLPPRARAELVRDAARAVGHAHARGVVHRDLKPDNLLVGHDGRLHVADFGLALFDGADRLTRTGGFVGTPHYMAPELFASRVREEPGPAADVWALGVILYEALTGRLPFDAPDLVGLMAQLEHARVTPPRKIDPSLERALEAVCLRALERDRAKRFADGDALAQALDDVLSGSVQAGGRSRAIPVALGVAAAALVGVAGTFALRPPAAPVMSAGPSAATVISAPTPARVEEPIVDRQLVVADTLRWAVWADARRVVTGGPDDSIRLWDAATGEELRSWSRPSSTAARLGAGRVIVGSGTGLHALVIDGEAPPTSLARFVAVKQVVCAEGSGHVAVMGRTAEDPVDCVYLLQPDGGGRRQVHLVDDGRAPLAIALTPDGSKLAVSMDQQRTGGFQPGGTVLLFTATGADVRLKDTVVLPSTGTALVLSPDGKTTLVGTTSGQLGLIVNRTATVRDHFLCETSPERAHVAPVQALALSPDGQRLFSVADGAETGGLEAKAWRFEPCRRTGSLLTAPGQSLMIDLSPDGRALVIGTRAGGVHVRVIDG